MQNKNRNRNRKSGLSINNNIVSRRRQSELERPETKKAGYNTSIGLFSFLSCLAKKKKKYAKWIGKKKL